MADEAHPFNYSVLDPGIRDTVRLLREHGFATTDSGDGISKPPVGRTMDYPHVFATVDRIQLFAEADRMQRILGLKWLVEGVYLPGQDGACLLQATQPDIREGVLQRG